MIRPIRRTLSIAATAGLLTASLSGCSLFGGGLGCGDLESAATDNNITAETSASDVSVDDVRNLSTWMVDNADSFEDAELGAAVKTFGENAVAVFEYVESMENIDASDADALADMEAKGAEVEAQATDMEAASTTISEKCTDAGFNFG